MAGPTRGPGTRRSRGGGPARRPRAASSPRKPGSRTGNGSRPRTSVEPGTPATDRSRSAPAPRASASGRTAGLRASLTGRAAVLALVLGVLAVSYAYPLRGWYDQHQERTALRAEAERLEAEVAELETQLRLWDDPAYVQAQARERLGYVLPGEVGYVVVDEAGSPHPELGPDGLPVQVEGEWYSRLWTSLEIADLTLPEDAR
jgi:cell division protein FtsB